MALFWRWCLLERMMLIVFSFLFVVVTYVALPHPKAVTYGTKRCLCYGGSPSTRNCVCNDIKPMFSRISDVLQTAADVLAPPASRFEDFEYHWKMILNFYHTYDDSAKIHVEETRIPHHFHQMLQLIVEEEEEQQGGTVGACLEAIVNRKVCLLELLPAMAAVDRPPGARALALSTATQLLRRTKHPCLNSASVFRPLQRMLSQCCEIPASPTEREEVELLLTLCGLVRKEPGLANVFTSPFLQEQPAGEVPEDIQKLLPLKRSKYKPPKKNPLFEVELTTNPLRNVSIVRATSREDAGIAASSSSAADENASCKSQKTVYEDNDKFLLIDLLLAYLNSADNQVVLRACEGIMIVTSLPEEDIANLVAGSPACETIVGRLASAFKALPAHLDPNDVDHLNTTWAYVAQDFGDKSYNKFHGYRELTCFFSWLDYCDTLMKECHPSIAAHLSRTFRASFLEGAAEAGLRLSSPHAALVAAVLAKSLKVIDSTELINEFSLWLASEDEVSEWSVLHTLVTHCLTNDHRLTVEALRFLESIIEKGTEHSLQRLVLCRLATRGYMWSGPPEEEEDRDRLNDVPLWRERETNREAMKQLEHESAVGEHISDILSHEGLPNAPADHNIHRIINSFLLLLPRAILSDPVGSDYEHYIHDAHRQYQLWLDWTANFNWPTEYSDNTASSTHSYDSRPEADLHIDELIDTKTAQKCCQSQKCFSQCAFSQTLALKTKDLTPNSENDDYDEGPFLKMLFKLLSNMPSQPYQVNLHLTSIISKLALLPHPNLHEYLLNPMLPTAKNTRTLFKVLQDLAKKLTMEIPKLKNYKQLIETTRLSLMSEDPSYDESGDHNQLVESLIVLEEFCKELAAITFVKYQHTTHMHI